MKKRIVFVLFLVWGCLSASAQGRILSGEFFWGNIDPGNGNGVAFTAQDGNFGDAIEQLIANGQNVPNLTSPIRFNVRVKDYNNLWGPTYKKVVFLSSNLPTEYNVAVTQAEYFFGTTDPGSGLGTQLVVFDGNWNEAIEAASVSNANWNLSEGITVFNVRAKDGAGNWGPLFKKAISVQSQSSDLRLCKVQSAEFFFGTNDPGAGNATALLVLDGAWSDAIETAYQDNVTWSLSNGVTLFNVRVKDESNNWGPLYKKTMSVQSTPTNSRLCSVVAGEFFFGVNDPGAGSATTILAFDGNYNEAIEQAFQEGYAWSVQGNTNFNIRFKDEANQWGPIFKKAIFVNQAPTPRDWKITFAEYFFGIFDPGVGTGNIIVAFDGNLDQGVEVLLRSSLTWDQAAGSTLFNIRVKDETNKWGPVYKRTIFFNGDNPSVNLIAQGESISRCPEFSVTLDYVGPNGYNVVWENGVEGNSVTFTPSSSGYFSMYAYLGNSYLYDSIYVNIFNLPNAVVDPAGEILVCASSNVPLTASAGSNYSYQWYQDGVLIPGSTQQTYFPTQVGAYTVLVTDNNTTCQQLSSPTTFYLTTPIFPTGTVSTACNPGGVQLTAPVGTGNTYQWKKNGANISGATSATYLAATAGNYNVVVTNGQCVSTSATTVVTNTGSTVNATISPEGNISLCDGGNVQLTAASGSGYTYQWKKDGVNLQGAVAQTYLATSAGSYTVQVTATGCSLTSAATILQVGTTVIPSVSITAGTNSICSGTNVTFTAGATNGGSTPSYQWKLNGNNVGTNSSTYSNNALANNDVVTVVMTSNASCASPSTATSNAVTMTVNAAVTPALSIVAASNPICSGGNFSLTATPSNGGSSPTYQWRKNGINISGGTGLTYSTTSAVNGDVFTCVMTSNNACQTSGTTTSNGITAQVSNSITPTANITASSTSVCSGGSVTFTGTVTGGGSSPVYQWKKNGVNISGATSIDYTTSSIANNDVFSLQLTSNAGCVTTSIVTSNVVTIAVSNSVIPSVSITAGTNSICSGTNVTFTAGATNGGTTPSYQWKLNGNNVGTNSSSYSNNALANNDVVTVVMTSNASCASPSIATSNAVTMTVNAAVTPALSIVASSNPICSGGNFSLTATPSNGGSSPTYQWRKNGTNISGGTGLTYSTTSAVNGDVFTCVMTSNNACQTSGTTTSNGITAQVSNSITPTSNITASSTSVCTGGSVTFTGTVTGGGSSPVYQWKKNGVNISGATSIDYTTSSIANNDVFSLQLTSNAGCVTTSIVTSNAITIAVSNSVIPSVSITAGTNNICSGTNVTFTAVATNGGTTPSYQWKLNGNNVGTNSSTYSNNALANNDVVTVVMTSNASCAFPSIATSNAVTMTVNAAVTPALSIVAVSNPICSGGNFSLTATPSNGGSSPTYQWRKNGTNISGGTGLTYSTTSAVNGDVFTCVMTSNNACQTSVTTTSNGITAQVSNSITPTANITANSTSVCSGGSVTFTGTVTGGGSSPVYQWKKNGVNISGATSIDYTTSSIANNDVFSLQLTSNAGCVTTSIVTSNAVTMSVLSAVTYYLDEDADGFGTSSTSISTCSIPAGYSVNSNDCNDNDNTINPGVNEQCWNQLDDNCNGAVDENCAILGCVDPVACNFNPQANQSDNSCQYPPNYYNCEGNCIVDTDGDGVCDQLEVLGCTLSNACNFNPLATELDGSCILPQPEICNGIDDNCNGLTDEGVTVNSVTAVNAITKLYPTCSGSNMLAANLNLGSNSPITEGDGLDLWYRLTAQRNSLRAALSAATGVNAVEIYQQVGSCMQLLGSEQEVGVSNQTLYYDDLVVGNEYFVVCRNLSGPANTSAKICFNHFDGTTCDHVYSGNTGVYSNVCVSFKAVYKANVANYVFNVNSASSAGNSISIVPWTYVTPTSSSIITRIGTLLPANFTASPITYGLTIGVTYVLQDAAGNTHYISADGTTPCTATLNPELPVALRATDRCPNIKAINNSIATDRQICGASRYEWEFTQLLPTPSTAVIVQGGLNTNVLFLNAVPGMANGKTYNVRVRSRHSSGSIGEWGPSHCLKTTGSGMILEPELESFLSLSQGNEGVSVYPNPSSQAVLNVQSMDGWMSERLSIQIWDVQGKRIFTKDIYASGAQFSLPLSSSFSDGLYWIVIKDGNTEHRLRWVLSK